MNDRVAAIVDRFWRPLDKRAFAVVATTVLVRLFWVLTVHAAPVSDFLFYWLRAGELAAGKGYLFNGHPTAYWPPGYPLLLAAIFKITGAHMLVVRLVNVGMWGIAAWCVYVVGKRLGGPAVGLIAGLVVALYPEYVYFTGLVASENLFVLLVCVEALLLTIVPKTRRHAIGLAAATGALVGYGMITRPASVLLPFALIVGLLVWRRRAYGFTMSIVLLLFAALAVAPWMIRNKIVLGEAVLATNGGGSVWGGAHAGTTGTFLPADQRPSWMRPARTVQAEITENREGTKAATQYMREHPIEWLSVAPTKFVGLFEEPSGLAWSIVYDENGEPGGRPLKRPMGRLEAFVVKVARLHEHVPGAMRWLQGLEWFFGALGLTVAVVRKRTAAVWPLAIIVYWVLFQITFSTGQPRYLVSVGPLLGPGIGYLAALAFGRVRPVEEPESAEATDMEKSAAAKPEPDSPAA